MSIDDKEFDKVAQLSHFAWGALVILVEYTLGLSLVAILWTLPVGVAMAAWKEFYWDYAYESVEVRGSSLKDFLFYCLGMGFAMGLILFRFVGASPGA